VVLVVGIFAIFLPTLITNYRELDALREQELQQRRQLQEARDRYRELAAEKQELESDPERVELLARDKLGYVREGEVVYIFPSPPAPAATP